MNRTQKCFELTALAAALMVAFGPAMAQDPEGSPAPLDQPVSSVSVGLGYWSDDRPQLGMFDGMRDDGAYLLLDADIVKRDDDTGTWKTLEIRSLGTDAREIRGEYLRQGDFGVNLEYNQIPRLAPYTINTGVTGLGTTEQVVPSPGLATGALAGRNVQLETERQKLGVGFYKNFHGLMPGLDAKINFTNERKEGTRHWGRGSAPEFAAEPIDYTTNTLEALLNYSGGALQLSGGYVGSWFKNDNDLVCSRLSTVSCTGTFAGNTSNPAFLSVPFDNEAHQVYLSGAYRFTPTTQGTFKVSYTRATQDEHIPTADIPGLASPLAPTSLDGEVNTTLVLLGLTTRPMPKLSLVANVRYHDVDDQTPAHGIVFPAATPTVASVHATPMSYETLSGKLEGTYSLPQGYSVTAGVDYSEQDRTVPMGTLNLSGQDNERYVPFRSDLDEITYRLQLRKSLSETLNGSVAYLHSKRDGSAYSEAIHSEPGEGIHPESIDPIHIADRDRDKWRLAADWAPTEALGLQFVYENSDDKYSGHTFGVRDGDAQLFSIDATFVISPDWQLTAWASHDRTKAFQRGWREGSATLAELDKRAHFKDTGNSIGLGFKGIVSPRLKVGADLGWTRTESEIHQDLTPFTISPLTGLPVATAGTAIYAPGTSPTQLPDIESTMTTIRLFAEYALQKNADIRVDLIHERWKSDDWTWFFADGSHFQYGTTNDGTTVVVDPKQTASFVGVRYNYKF